MSAGGQPPAVARPDRLALAGERVLLVDDNPRNLQIMLQFLGGRGYGLLVAKSGEAALDIARKTRPAVVLLDVMMPGIDGFETCRRLKADPATREAAVLFLSAASETEQKLAGFAAGGVDYITKPMQADEVVARVDTHLTIRRLNAELHAKIGEIERELSVVREMQRRLLPIALPRIATLDLAAYYSTSRYAGGDYYDVVPIADDRWGILVADVSGHGTPAAVTMAMTRTAFHARPELYDRPADVLRTINDQFEYMWEEAGFVTALYGVYDARRRTLTSACAGHPRPLLYRPAGGGEVVEVEHGSTMPLLIGPLSEAPVGTIELAPGDRLLFYTDGVTERSDADDEFFGAVRLGEALRHDATAGDGGAEAIVRQIVESVDSFAIGREAADDQTLLLGVVT